MNEKLVVRSMLVDKSTGKYIKVIDEVGIDDFINHLTATPSQTIPDFREIINYQHNHLEKLLQRHANDELQVKRGQVFNLWVRLKTLTNDHLKHSVVSDVMSKSEEVLGWLHIRMNSLIKEYNAVTRDNSIPEYQKCGKLTDIVNEVEAFIEITLCNIHATSSVDITSLKSDTIITGHCEAFKKLLVDMIWSEASTGSRRKLHESYISHFIMEDVGINSDALLTLLGIDTTSEIFKQQIINSIETSNQNEQYGNRIYETRVCSYSYPIANSDCIKNIKMLSLALQKISSVLDLLEILKTTDMTFEAQGSAKDQFELELKLLTEDLNSH